MPGRFGGLALLLLSLAACGGGGIDLGVLNLGTLDQALVPGAQDAVVGVGNVGAYAQTFTVGLTGTLTSVDLLLSAQGPDDVIRVDVRMALGGTPSLDDGAVLASRTLAATSLPAYPASAFVTIDFSASLVAVVAGQQLAIVVLRTVGGGGGDVLWFGENQAGEEYAGGTFLQRTAGNGTAWTPLGYDYYFRTRVLVP